MPRYSQYDGPGAPGAALYAATIRLSNADILTLPTTPSALVVAGEPGLLLVPVFAVCRLNTLAGAFGNLDPTAFISVGWGAATPGGLAGLLGAQLGAIADALVLAGPFFDPATGGGAVVAPASDAIGKPLLLLAGNGALGDFTLGNAANTLDVTVYYLAQ